MNPFRGSLIVLGGPLMEARMPNPTFALCALPIALLAACGSSSSTPANQAGAAETAAAYQQRILAMPAGERDGVFIRAIRDAGQDCQHVASSVSAGVHQGRPVWTAHCDGGHDFTIALGDHGSATVINAAEARLADERPTAQNRQ